MIGFPVQLCTQQCVKHTRVVSQTHLCYMGDHLLIVAPIQDYVKNVAA